VRALALALAFPLIALNPGQKPPDPPAPPPSPPPASVAVSRVDVTFKKDAVRVITDVTLEVPPGAREIFVAYGSPGVPTAFDARLVPVPGDRFSAEPKVEGTALATTHATHAPSSAWLTLGPRTSAGQLVKLDETALRAAGGAVLVTLRLRSVHATTGRNGRPRSVLARVSLAGKPLPLGTITVQGEGLDVSPKVTLCGASTPDVRLSIGAGSDGESPALAPRAAGQDLCVVAMVNGAADLGVAPE
jgi:hypothetical protein